MFKIKFADDTSLLVPENLDIPLSDKLCHSKLWVNLTD